MNQTEIEQISEELFFVAGSAASRRLRTQAELLSQTHMPLLITGEVGAGKATVARLIHSLSIRSSFPFLKVNCAALTADLLESELYGYEHSGLLGRTESKPGKIEQCGQGTILLQDLEAMPSSVQSRFLKLLQTHEFVRFGGQSVLRSDVRIMATTSRNLAEAVAEGRLNEDLYDRLSAFELIVPPLRDRHEEIPLLFGHFLNRLTRRYGVPTPSFSTSLLDACRQYSWPGNLRQFEVFVKRFLVVGDESAALQELASQPIAQGAAGTRNGEANGHTKNGHADDKRSSLKVLVRQAKGEAERNAIAQALEETHWNRKAAARVLSISYRALLYKIQEYHLIPQESLVLRGQRQSGSGGF
jgi:two-component system, NtrC family, response regulator AtoC